MAFLTFEDEIGTVEATFFPAVYDRYCHILDHGRPYLLWGRVERDRNAVTLTVERVAGRGGRKRDHPPLLFIAATS